MDLVKNEGEQKVFIDALSKHEKITKFSPKINISFTMVDENKMLYVKALKSHHEKDGVLMESSFECGCMPYTAIEACVYNNTSETIIQDGLDEIANEISNFILEKSQRL